MKAGSVFGVGIGGTSLSSREQEILERFPPRAVILFRRNIEGVEQLSLLASRLKSPPSAPFLCLDQEGGPVDRLRDLLGPTISFREAAQTGRARLAGELAGEACARFSFDVDLAPVVDRLLPGASEKVLRDRCASSDPEEIARAASEFLAGLASRGVGGCVKHFPGLGRADLDTHKELPALPDDPGEEERDLAPFRATMDAAGAVMISHAAGADGIPASLSPEKATGLLRGAVRSGGPCGPPNPLGFRGAAFSDDLEMGALAAFGELPRRCALAMEAGCDLLFVCSRIEEYPDCAAAVGREIAPERIAQAAGRLDAYARRLEDLRRAATGPDRPLAALIADIRELRES